jgi:predicted PurR-regulated permease PerM
MSTRSVARATLTVLLWGLGFALAFELASVIGLVLMAVLLGTAVLPLVDWLSGHGLERRLSASLVFALLAALLILVGWLALPSTVERFQNFLARLPEVEGALKNRLGHSSNLVIRGFAAALPGRLRAPPAHFFGGTLLQMARAIANLFALVLISFFFALHGRRAVSWLLLLTPRVPRADCLAYAKLLESRIGSYVRAQAVVCAIVGVLALVGYHLIHLPDAAVLGVFAGMFEIVPFIGPILGAAPALLIAFSVAPHKALEVVLIAGSIHLFESTYLFPRAMKNAVGVPRGLGILAITAFGMLGGIMGALLAVPIVMAVLLFLERLFGIRYGDAP